MYDSVNSLVILRGSGGGGGYSARVPYFICNSECCTLHAASSIVKRCVAIMSLLAASQDDHEWSVLYTVHAEIISRKSNFSCSFCYSHDTSNAVTAAARVI